MADLIRGAGLVQADTALAASAEDPEQVDRARGRFSESPPSYRSHLSHNSARSQSPNPPNEEEQRREDWKWQLIKEHEASFPYTQLRAQINEENDRIIKADETRIRFLPVGMNIYELADKNIKERWFEQGIWNEKWEKRSVWRWKHEEPFEPESESEPNSEAEDCGLFQFSRAGVKKEPRRPKSDEELRRIAERRPLREREREGSRPLNQFVYQVSKEREWIQDVINAPKYFAMDSNDIYMQTVLQALARSGWPHNELAVRTNIPDPPDINTMAYETVKKTWMKRGLWNKKWGILPGMAWKHEQPLEEMLREEMGDDPVPDQADALDGNDRRTGEAPLRSLFEPLPLAGSNDETSGMLDTSSRKQSVAVTSNAVESSDHGTGRGQTHNVSRPPSFAESGHGPVSVSLNTPPQELPLAIAFPGSPNGDASPSSVASHLQSHHEESREHPRSPPFRTQRRGNRELSVEDGQLSRTERNALGPNDSSKISKARGKNESNTQRRPKASTLLSHARQLSADLDHPAVPTESSSAPPRRSRRLQAAKREITADFTGITAVDPNDGSSQPRLARVRLGSRPAASAKPRGPTKRRPGTARGRSR